MWPSLFGIVFFFFLEDWKNLGGWGWVGDIFVLWYGRHKSARLGIGNSQRKQSMGYDICRRRATATYKEIMV